MCEHRRRLVLPSVDLEICEGCGAWSANGTPWAPADALLADEHVRRGAAAAVCSAVEALRDATQRLSAIHDRVRRIRAVLSCIRGGLVETLLEDIERLARGDA